MQYVLSGQQQIGSRGPTGEVKVCVVIFCNTTARASAGTSEAGSSATAPRTTTCHLLRLRKGDSKTAAALLFSSINRMLRNSMFSRAFDNMNQSLLNKFDKHADQLQADMEHTVERITSLMQDELAHAMDRMVDVMRDAKLKGLTL